MEGNLHFKANWASLIVGRKFTILALFYFVFEGNFQVQCTCTQCTNPKGEGGAYIWRSDLTEGFFLHYEFEGLTHFFSFIFYLNIHYHIYTNNLLLQVHKIHFLLYIK